MSLKVRLENHAGFYKKIAGISAACLVIAGILVAVFLLWKRGISNDFRVLMDSLTYKYENSGDEIIALRNYGELEHLSDRELAEYYGAQTRLYSLVQGYAGGADSAYTNGIIYAQRCGAMDLCGWLCADYAQILLNISAWAAAADSVKFALDYTKDLDMDEEYYAYCYSILAFAYSCMDNSNLNVVWQYYNKAVSFSDNGFFEDFPADILNSITCAQLLLREQNYERCQEALDYVKQYLDSEEQDSGLSPSSVSLVTRYELPYYKTKLLLSLGLGDADGALAAFEAGYQLAEKYQGYNMVMNFLADVIPEITASKTVNGEDNASKQLDTYIREASMRYMGLSETMSSSLGRNMLSSVNLLIARVAQEHETVLLYRVILTILVGVVLIILLMTSIILIVRHKGNVDGLTGAYNRRCFDRKYLSLCQKGKDFGVIMYDIDFFKQHNDTYGHAFGDKVLRGVSGSVTELLSHKKAKLYRYGGDEFVVLWRKCSLQALIELAQQTEDMVKGLKWEVETSVSLSIGVAVSGQTEEPLKLADENVYVAKESGRGCVKAKITFEQEKNS